MPKKPVILPQVGTGFDDVFSILIHDPKKKKPVDKPENPSDDKDKSEVNMAGAMDDQKITVTCPKCGFKKDYVVGYLRLSPKIKCENPNCPYTIKMDATDLDEKLKKVDKSIDDLKNAFNRLN